jgi:hypothetical protein
VTQTTAFCGPRPVANRHAVALRELAHGRVEVGGLLLGHGLRARGLDRDRVAEPVGTADEEEPDAEPDDQPAGAEQGADPHQEATEGGEEDEGLERVPVHGHGFFLGPL